MCCIWMQQNRIISVITSVSIKVIELFLFAVCTGALHNGGVWCHAKNIYRPSSDWWSKSDRSCNHVSHNEEWCDDSRISWQWTYRGHPEEILCGNICHKTIGKEETYNAQKAKFSSPWHWEVARAITWQKQGWAQVPCFHHSEDVAKFGQRWVTVYQCLASLHKLFVTSSVPLWNSRHDAIGELVLTVALTANICDKIVFHPSGVSIL